MTFTATLPRLVPDAAPTSMAYSCDEIYVWPNPYFGYNPEERTAVDNQIHFGGLSAMATIRIYDLAGNLVRKIDHSTGNSEVWDVKNSFNILVASPHSLALKNTQVILIKLKVIIHPRIKFNLDPN